MKVFTILIIFLLFKGCETKENGIIKWNIEIKKSQIGELYLSTEFYATKDTSFIFDYKAFNHYCYEENYEQIIKDSNYNIHKMLSLIKFSQVIIENKNHEMRFFSDFQILDDERTRILESFDCSGNLSIFIKLLKNEPYKLGSIRLTDIEDTLVNSNDKKVRFHYLFSVNEEQVNLGFINMIISSNWIKIPPYE